MLTYSNDAISGLYFYHTDALGSVAAMSSSNGHIAETYRYTPYGRPTIYDAGGQQITQSSIGNPYMFTGRRYDAGTGLYYYRARMYSPKIGRFLQTDPLGYFDTINPYAYCGNNPVNWIDPWGLCRGDREKGIFEKIIDFLTVVLPYGNPDVSSPIAQGMAGASTFCNARAKQRARNNKLARDDYREDEPYRPPIESTPYIYLGMNPKTGKEEYIFVGNKKANKK
ncbi:hypothetical protein STSP1_00947 [Sedimentisphaera salicampi]|uniref:Teneurin-like YD-shell domain-containing protein n=2 Tax=Sedimentisphaera salicampi TaxID=1941349 RepID=A0A1W6LLE3_9BACT|nr:hypothetical protein STSP1_00947 [Sedimentisphaera salicampi]